MRRCICSVVDESPSSLAACCVSFYQIVCLSVCQAPDEEEEEELRKEKKAQKKKDKAAKGEKEGKKVK